MEVKNNLFLNGIGYYGIFDKIQESMRLFDVKNDNNNKNANLIFKQDNPVAGPNFDIKQDEKASVLYILEVMASPRDMDDKMYINGEYDVF